MQNKQLEVDMKKAGLLREDSPDKSEENFALPAGLKKND